jgi:hypothetical protein
VLSPPFAHGAPDIVEWQLSPADEYVAMVGDFASDGLPQLYLTDLRGANAGTPQLADESIGHVTAFDWQPR